MADYKQPSTELIGENELVGDFSRHPSPIGCIIQTKLYTPLGWLVGIDCCNYEEGFVDGCRACMLSCTRKALQCIASCNLVPF